MTITRIEVSVSVLERGFRFFDPGGAGSSVHFAADVLSDLYAAAGMPEILGGPSAALVGQEDH
jgi:hypothetical protein